VAAKEIGRVRAELDGILAAHTGRTREQVRADTDRDLVLDAVQAVEYGVADAVLDSRKRPAWR
jgi:ATP-dependent Clp protease protease subunit